MSRSTDLLSRRGHRLWFAGVFLVVFVVYWWTAAPGIFYYDSTEFSAQAINLGLAHPTGYVLWALLAKLATLVPDLTALFGGGNDEHAVFMTNLTAGFFGALSSALLFTLTYRLLGSLTVSGQQFPRWMRLQLSVVAAGILAFTGAVWNNSTVAEVYTLNLFFALLVVFLLLRWEDIVRQNPFRANALILLMAYLLGIAATNHMSIVLIFPGIAIYILWTHPGILRRWWLIPLSAVFFAMGIILYVYLPLRDEFSAIKWFDIDSWEAFWYYFTAKSYQATGLDFVKIVEGLRSHMLGNFSAEVLDWLKLSLGQGDVLGFYGGDKSLFLPIPIFYAILAAVALFLRYPSRLFLVGIIFLSHILYFSSYQSQNRDMILVAYAMVAILAVLGIATLALLIARSLPRWTWWRRNLWPKHAPTKESRSPRLILAMILVALHGLIPIYMFSNNWQDQNRHSDYTAQNIYYQHLDIIDEAIERVGPDGRVAAIYQGDAMAPLLVKTKLDDPSLDKTFHHTFLTFMNNKGVYQKYSDEMTEEDLRGTPPTEMQKNEETSETLFIETRYRDTEDETRVIRKPGDVRVREQLQMEPLKTLHGFGSIWRSGLYAPAQIESEAGDSSRVHHYDYEPRLTSGSHERYLLEEVGLFSYIEQGVADDSIEVFVTHKDPAPKVNRQILGLNNYFYTQGWIAEPQIGRDGTDLGLGKLIPRRTLDLPDDTRERSLYVSLAAEANADYRSDPFLTWETAKERDSKDHFPALNPKGQTLFYKQKIPFTLPQSGIITDAPSIITLNADTPDPVTIELHNRPSEWLMLAVVGGSIQAESAVVLESQIQYDDGSTVNQSWLSAFDIWEYWFYGPYRKDRANFLPADDILIWSQDSSDPDAQAQKAAPEPVHDVESQWLHLLPIRLDPTRSPVSITLVRPTISCDKLPKVCGAGVALFAMTQVAKSVDGEPEGEQDG